MPSPRSRVVFVNSLFPCLSETFVFDQMMTLREQGLPISFISNHRPQPEQVHPHMQQIVPDVWYLQETSIPEVLAAHVFAWQHLGVRRYLSALGDVFRLQERLPTTLAQFSGALLLLRRFRHEAIHLHAHFTYGAAAVAWWCHRLAGIPYSLTLHGADLLFDEPADLHRKLRDATALVSISNSNFDVLARRFPDVMPAHRAVIPLGVLPLPSALAPVRGPVLRLLNVGRLSDHKAQHVLIDACARLRALGVAFVCGIVGSGPLQDELQAQIDHLGLQEQVRLLGPMFHDEVLRLYRQYDVFVSTSIVEGMPVVLMEAMNACVPVVATRVGAVAELVGDAGFLVPPGDPDAVAEALLRLSQEDEADLIARAHARIVEKFDAKTNHRRFAAFLSELPVAAPFDASL